MGSAGAASLLLLREASPWTVLGGVAAALLLWWAVQVLEWTWWAPRRLERALRAQGLSGTRYRFLWGDTGEDQRLRAAALARPAPTDRPHDVLPRVFPLFHRVFQQHGKLSFTWFGPIPRVTITDPELVRGVLTNKSGDFIKTRLATGISRLLVGGLVVLDGEKWVKHRRIMNPAFHAEKLKGMLPAFTASCSELIGRWEDLVAASAGPAELDIWPEFQNLSGDVISRAVFGVSFQEEGRRIFLLQAEQAERLVRSFRTNYIPGFSLLPTENNRRNGRAAVDGGESPPANPPRPPPPLHRALEHQPANRVVSLSPAPLLPNPSAAPLLLPCRAAAGARRRESVRRVRMAAARP